MWQLATFYNPAATNFIQAIASDDNTIATSNQLGREEAELDASVYDDSLDASSKIHDLEEDHFSQTTSGTQVNRLAAIDYLPNFAFYTRS